MITKQKYVEYLVSTPINYTCTNLGCFCLTHNGGRFLRRHDHIDNRGRFRQFEQVAVGGIALNQRLALIHRIYPVAGGSELQIDSIAVFGPVVAGPHNGPYRFLHVFLYQ